MRHRNKQRTRTSIRVLQISIIVLTLVIFGRIFQLQILDHETYGPLSRENSLRQEIVPAARGLIFDRNGQLIVDNEPIYSINITPASFDPENTPLLAELMNMPEEEVAYRVQRARNYSWYRSSRLFTEIDFKTFSVIQENAWRLPGIGHQIESKRHYPLEEMKASHILGYLRELSEQEYRESENYHLGDKSGKSGLEMVYEQHLRGESGTQYVEVNAMGQALGSYENGSIDESPKQGSDLFTTIDSDLQILAEDLMEGKNGAVVALDPDNGAILSLVSSPQYDIRRLSGRIDSEYWASINADSARPLYNRAISGRQPPGSTIKPLMSLMGLELNIITENTEINNPGYYYRGRRYNDLADPGTYNVTKALEQSSNTFFLWLMDEIIAKYGINKWHEMASDFGFGEVDNIDLPHESSGVMADSTYLNRILGERNWGLGDLLNLGIGQGFISVSPLQMALLAAEIGNGGYRIQPHLVEAIRQNDGTMQMTQTSKNKIDWVKDEHIEIVKNGMRQVVLNGSGRFYANIDSIAVAGKTGTAQNPHGQDHAWFISFAPVDNPQIAVAVLVENAGYGSISSAPIASLLIEKYLQGSINRPYVYDYVKNFEPREVQRVDTTQQEVAPANTIIETEGQP